jgi:hypothetical protein
MTTKNDIENPLKLTWNGTDYKVNKSNINNLDLVDLSVAKELQSRLTKQSELMDRMAAQLEFEQDLRRDKELYDLADLIEGMLAEYKSMKEGTDGKD